MGALFVALTLVGYLGAAILFVAQLYDLKQAKWALLLGWVGFVSQSLWLIQRGIALAQFPAATLYDWVAFFVWVAVGLFLAFGRRLGMRPVGAFLFPVVFVVWLMSQGVSGNDAPGRHPMGVLLVLHVVVAALGDVSFLLASVFGIMYIEKERELKNKRVRLFYYQLPALGDMDAWSGRFVAAGWGLFTATLVTGALWGHATGSAYWMWNAKQIWSFMTWAIYGALFVARYVGKWHGHRLATWSMIAFLVVLVNVFGVNLLFPGPHHAIL